MFHCVIIIITTIIWSFHVGANTENKSLIYFPMSLTSRLESNFIREYNETFSFTDFISPSNALSSCAHSQQAELFVSRMASFISYSSEFNSLIGYKPEIKLIASRPVSVPFAHEGGAFVPTTNEVWFTVNQLPIQNTNPSIITPNGANYFDDSVYICSQGNQTTSGGIYAVNPTTLVSRLVVNSWFGLRLNSPNDVTFTRKIGGGKYMWFTDPQVAYMQDFGSSPQLGSYVYRFDLTTSELRPVITDLVVPNGIAFDLNETTLYVSDTAPSSYGHGTFMVYAYDLNKHGLPINRHVFSVSSAGIPDGIKVDKMGRVWTGEGDGINVRDHHGTLLGVILGRDLCQSGVISNFAIVGNLVIILAQEKVWQLKLTTSVL
ncbi:unnamed protein product [Rotaria magnacalcarata]|uniref:SMP-30/Gluconolactonase/LRE-like region domain-containing protein n=2 Tax=Rotaria TaxID=231623 RepID=A0A816Y373_9BILA|nr:unnamed protein product [Rotaria magnacalcarata]